MRRQITSSTALVLEPLGAPRALDQPLYAINWFNTRRAWLYTLYNYVAAAPLIRTGARVFMKARLREVLHGDKADRRDLLLIVNYPCGEKFLDLLGNRFFQLISVLRIAAVKDFSFVLHKRIDGIEPLASKSQTDSGAAYAVHHFTSSAPMEREFSEISTLVADQNISLCFASEKAAAVATENSRDDLQTMPFVTHKLVLFEAGSSHELKSFLVGRSYRHFCSSLDSSFIATLDRIM